MDQSFLLVAQKSVRGVFALISRTFIIQILGIATFFVISARLDPEIFGIYVIAQSALMVFNYFQDVGLAASLIQKKNEPTLSDYRSVFTLQQIVVLTLVLPAILFSGHLSSFYGLNTDGRYLLIALLIAFFLTSLRTIPTVILERKLDFGKLVIPQIGENLVFNLTLIVMVLMDYGIFSFTLAVLARGIVGLVLTYVIQPWKIGLELRKKSLKELLSFGIPFQTNNILALFKDDFLIIYIGKVLPFTQVGYIGFAQKLAFYPLRLIMDNVIRITFPSYARLQHDKQALKVAIEKSLFLISFFIFPTAVAFITLSGPALEVIPQYNKWQPAVLSLAFFALNTVFSSIATPLTNFLNAIGKVKITLYFMSFWTVTTWAATLFLISQIGYEGVAIASFLISVSSLFVIVIARRYVQFSLISPIIKQLLAAVLMFTSIFLLRENIQSITSLILISLLGGVVYLASALLLSGSELLKTGRFIISTIKKP